MINILLNTIEILIHIKRKGRQKVLLLKVTTTKKIKRVE